MKQAFLSQGAAFAVALCVVVGSVHAATPESSLNKCQKTISREVAKLAKGYQKNLSGCLDRISREIIQKGGDDAARAVKACAQKLLKIVNNDKPDKTLAAKMRAKVDKACNVAVNARLEHNEEDILGGSDRGRAAQSLKASALGEYCSAFGGDGSVDSLREWQDCLHGAAAFHAYHQIVVAYPRAAEWLTQLRADLFRLGDGPQHDGSIDALDGVVTSIDPDKDAFIDKIGPFTCGLDVVFAESIGFGTTGMNRVCVSTCYLLICTDAIRPAAIGFPLRHSYDVALGDIDGDGSKEAVFANYGTPNRIYRGPYDLVTLVSGGFVIPSDINTDELFTSGVALGDLDHDDDLDIVFANHDVKDDTTGERDFLGAANQVCENDVPNPIGCSDISNHTDFSYDVDLGDVNGDGHIDAVFANGDCCSLESDKFYNRLCLNDGTGAFDCEHLIDFPRQIASLGVDLGDLDNDGDLDAVFAETAGFASRVCLNDGTGEFDCSDVSAAFADVHKSEAVALGDLDGDGNLDAVFANSATNLEIGVENRACFGDGSGSFPVCASISQDTNTSTDVAVADADGDGDLDVFFSNQESSANPNQRNRICLNGGNFVFSCYDLGTDETTTEGLAVGHLYP